MSCSLNSLKGGYIGDHIGDYYRAILSWSLYRVIWGFAKIRNTFSGVPIIRIMLGSPITLGNYHIGFRVQVVGEVYFIGLFRVISGAFSKGFLEDPPKP